MILLNITGVSVSFTVSDKFRLWLFPREFHFLLSVRSGNREKIYVFADMWEMWWRFIFIIQLDMHSYSLLLILKFVSGNDRMRKWELDGNNYYGIITSFVTIKLLFYLFFLWFKNENAKTMRFSKAFVQIIVWKRVME